MAHDLLHETGSGQSDVSHSVEVQGGGGGGGVQTTNATEELDHGEVAGGGGGGGGGGKEVEAAGAGSWDQGGHIFGPWPVKQLVELPT
jgi:hypothetical protein